MNLPCKGLEIVKSDKRYQDALNTLIKKSKNNQIYPETPHKSWIKYSFAQKDKYSEYATRRYLEIIKP